ncbi:hypothetical protein D3C78_1838100 [compost metagenome]
MESAHVSDLVRLDHGKRWALDCTSMAQAADQATRERGLASPQVTFEKNHAVTAGHFGKPRTKRDHGRFIGQKQV